MNAWTDPERIEAALDRIGRNRRSGASELALAAVRVLARARPKTGISPTSYVKDVHRLARRLSGLRRTMISIESAVARLLYVFEVDFAGERETASELWGALKRAAKTVEVELEAVAGEVESQFHKRFSGLRSPIVISYSSRVLRAVRTLDDAHVIVCESRPQMEGRRTATQLRASGVPVTVITDAQMGVAMPECDGVLLGCDGIFLDGSVVNKSGSYPLALVARAAKRPVIVVGDRFKIGDAATVPLESQPTTQVWTGAPRGVGLRNTAFEIVPAHLIDFIVFESGVLEPGRIQSAWEKIRATRRAPRP